MTTVYRMLDDLKREFLDRLLVQIQVIPNTRDVSPIIK